jgi:hypothetical protein
MLRAILRRMVRGGSTKAEERHTGRLPNDQKAMVNAILELRKIVKTGGAEHITAGIEAFKVKAEGCLEPRELASEVADAETMLTALSYAERLRRGEALTAVATMSDGGPCYYRGKNVALEGPRRDDYGQLDICDQGIFYEGSKRLTIPWDKVLTLSFSNRSLIVHRTSGGQPYDFETSSDGDARLAHAVALAAWQLRTAVTASEPRKSRSKQKSPRSEEIDSAESAVAPVGSSVELPGWRGIFSVQVVGESHCQAALKALGGERRLNDQPVIFTAALVPDPKNEYDPDAIRIYISGGPRVVYLSRDDAADYRDVGKALSARKAVGLCRAKLIGGTAAKPSIGVVLDLADPAATLVAITGNVQPF